MNVRITIAIILAAGAIFFALNARQPGMIRAAAGFKDTPAAAQLPDAGSTPVLVELFTSEGCSSCPPADALLFRLGRTQPVHGADLIVLEEHVDYWDRLGWKDPFSSEAATERQYDYGQAFGGEQVYTPQMVVDGRAGFNGSSESEALRAIHSAGATPKPAVNLSWAAGDMLAVNIDPLQKDSGGDRPQVVLAIAENMLHSDVKRGENAGRALEHNGVVRQFIEVGNVSGGQGGFSSTIPVHAAHEWNSANLLAVVFVQDRRNHHVLAAAAIPFRAA
jgi:hypothetical protein